MDCLPRGAGTRAIREGPYRMPAKAAETAENPRAIRTMTRSLTLPTGSAHPDRSMAAAALGPILAALEVARWHSVIGMWRAANAQCAGRNLVDLRSQLVVIRHWSWLLVTCALGTGGVTFLGAVVAAALGAAAAFVDFFGVDPSGSRSCTSAITITTIRAAAKIQDQRGLRAGAATRAVRGARGWAGAGGSGCRTGIFGIAAP